MRTRKAALVTLVASAALWAPPAAAEQPSYTPGEPLASVLARGQAELRIGQGLFDWSPSVGVPVAVEAFARVRERVRAGTRRRMWIRYQSPRRPCARSFTADRGTSLGRFDGATDKRGYLSSARVMHTWRRPGTVRFCTWLGPSRRSRTRPAVQDVVFSDSLFGASVATGGSLDPYLGDGTMVWGAASTVPLRVVRQETNPDPSCAHGPSIDDITERHGGDYYETSGLVSGLACAENTYSWTLALLAQPNGTPEVAQQGTLQYAGPERVLPVDTAPIRSLGACYLPTPTFGRTVAEAAAYLLAVGCRPGRVIKIPVPHDPYAPEIPNSIYSFYVHGGFATIVPPGTVVDMLLNGS